MNLDKKKKSRNLIEHFSGGTLISGILCCVIVIVLIIVIINFWSSYQRYSLASDALKAGRSDIAMGALAPEIGQASRYAGQGIGFAASGIGKGIGSAWGR